MPLGHQTVAKILDTEPEASNLKHVKGVYTGVRNKKILCRLYYHYQLRGLQYTRAVQVLNVEFDLSETRLEQLILENREVLEQLKQDKADSRYLQRIYPYFNWQQAI
jgi:hypothetical protein